MTAYNPILTALGLAAPRDPEGVTIEIRYGDYLWRGSPANPRRLETEGFYRCNPRRGNAFGACITGPVALVASLHNGQTPPRSVVDRVIADMRANAVVTACRVRTDGGDAVPVTLDRL